MTSDGFDDADAQSQTPESGEASAVSQPDAAEPVLVMAVTEAAGEQTFDETQLEQLADGHRVEVDSALADLQQQLASMARSGIPGVDAALARLGELDPNDLNGSAQILAEVLGQLEGVMNETPKEPDDVMAETPKELEDVMNETPKE